MWHVPFHTADLQFWCDLKKLNYLTLSARCLWTEIHFYVSIKTAKIMPKIYVATVYTTYTVVRVKRLLEFVHFVFLFFFFRNAPHQNFGHYSPNLQALCNKSCRSQWPRGLRRRSAAARLLRSWIRIPPGAWMFVCCECCVLSGIGLCDELITRPEESYRLWCVVVCDLEEKKVISLKKNKFKNHRDP